MKNDSQNWQTALHHQGHGIHLSQPKVRGWGSWWDEELGTITKAVPCPSLSFLWERNDQGYGWPTWNPLEECILLVQHIHQHGPKIILPLVSQVCWEHKGHSCPPKRGILLAGYGMWHMLGICQYVGTSHP